MISLSKRMMALVAGAACTVTVAGGAAGLALASPAAPETSGAATATPAHTWTFAVRGATTPRPAARSAAVGGGTDGAVAGLGLHTSQARTVDSPADAGDDWTVVPGDDGACVMLDADRLCGDADTFERDGAAVAWTTPPPVVKPGLPAGTVPGPDDVTPATTGDVVAEGLAVDAVDRAEVIDATGTVLASSDVTDSVFSISVPVADHPVGVRLLDAAGDSTIVLLAG